RRRRAGGTGSLPSRRRTRRGPSRSTSNYSDWSPRPDRGRPRNGWRRSDSFPCRSRRTWRDSLVLGICHQLRLHGSDGKMQAVSIMPSAEPRSYCPIKLSLEIFGDAWTLLVLRDMMFAGKRHFRELLQSDERIASNILANRLSRLVDHGVLTKADDP